LAIPDSASVANDTTLFFLKYQHRITNDLDSGKFMVNSGIFSIPFQNLQFVSRDSISLFPDNPFPQFCFFSLNPTFSFLGQKPLTIVQTEVNTNKEQLFYLAHKRDVAKSAGLWFKIFSFRSPGVFANALGNSFAIDWGGYFKFRQVKARIDAFHRKETFQLNGGVEPQEKDDSFSFLGNSRKLLAPKWTTLNFRKISTGANLELVFPIKFSSLDSVHKATSDTVHPLDKNLLSGFKLVSNYELNYFFMNQEVLPVDTFFFNRSFLFDSTFTKDRLRGSLAYNHFSFFSFSESKDRFFETSLSHAYAEQNQNYNKSIYHSLFVGIKGIYTFQKVVSTAHFDYGFSGYNLGNFSLGMNLKREFKFSSTPSFLEFSFVANKHSPSLLQRANFSNHFFWYNDFNDLQNTKIFLKVRRSILSGSIGYQSIRNHIYFSPEGYPTQNQGNFSYYFLQLSTQIEGRNFFAFPEVLFQKDNSQNQLLRIPELVVKSIIGYRWRLFNKALTLSPGFDLLFASKFKGNYFLPQTGQFIQQENQVTGGYLMANFFINFIIKDLKGYIKMDHVNDGIWPGNLGYFISEYPLQGRVIRIGFIWNLVN
jgi:hypothetical protein